MKKTYQTCITCKWREGSYCRKLREMRGDFDWCSAHKARATGLVYAPVILPARQVQEVRT